MWPLNTLWLVDRPVQLVIFALEGGFFFGPHFEQNLAGFAKGPHSVWGLRKLQTIGSPLMFVPTSPKPADGPSVAHHVYSGGHLRQQRPVTITVARHHLAHLHPRRISF